MKINKIKICFLYILNIILVKYFIRNNGINFNFKSKKRIGVIGLEHSQNVGNNLLKYAIHIKLSELGMIPYIIGKLFHKSNISFLKNHTNIILINNFSQINKNDFDILMVNSDQTWRKWNNDFYDIAFLRFSENWKIPKFVYAASLGYDHWVFNEKDEIIAKNLLNNFTGISVREISSVDLIEKHLGIRAQFVLDPTFLISKQNYLDLIKDFKSEIINQIKNNKFIFVYVIRGSNNMKSYMKYAKEVLNIDIFYITVLTKNQIKEFLYGIINSIAVITDSYHGTVFSIIFKKPFVSFINNFNDHSRFNSLGEIFNIKNRIFDSYTMPPISLLTQNLTLDDTKLMSLKKESIDYLKKNLNLK